MKAVQSWIIVAALVVMGGMSTRGNAVTEETNTQDLLIAKLEHVYKNLAPDDSSKTPVTLRLADLLAERARVASMTELDSGCTVCTAGEQDRSRALRLYLEAMPKTPVSSRGRVMLQVGHLYEMMGREKEAIESYSAITTDTAQGSSAADAYLSLAEIHFKKNHFKEAMVGYERVMNDTKAGSRGLAAYRLAWCQLNLGQIDSGLSQLKKILTTRDLQSKSGVAEGQADKQFVEEVSRDLATWMAKASIDDAKIEELAKLSPEAARQGNLITLAAELERTGKKAAGVQVWQYVHDKAPQPEVRLEAQIRLVTLLFTSDDASKSFKQLEQALASWQDLKGCGRADCSELQKSLRAFLVNWNQSEKKAPSENLQQGYQLYLKTFSGDAEVAQWGAQVAKDRKNYSAAIAMMHLASQDFLAKKDDAKAESALLSELEIAELSKDKTVWNATAASYLSLSPLKTKAFEVRYQQAHNIYDAGDSKTAQGLLRALALEAKAPRELRLQAAHLSLDALNLQKDESALSEDAKFFATTFGGLEAQEFLVIRYKAAMNAVAKLAEQNPDQAFLALTAVDVASPTPEDRKLFLKNKMILAEKSKRFDISAATAEDYLALKNLTPEEREFALSKKAWLSELRLDFVTAMKSTQSLQSSLKPDQKALKLAIYADLSGVESQAFYQQYLNLGSDPAVKQAIAAQLVRKSKAPLAELTKQSALIAKEPELLARMYTEIYVKSADPKVLAKILADKRIEKTNWGRSLGRVQMLNDLKAPAEKVASMKVDATNQKKMAATIKSRAAELAKLEKSVQVTVESGDWTSQLVGLEILARESERFYQEILSLPMPEGLSGDEETEYLGLLTQQASPYKSRADTARTKVTELWATAGWKDALQKSLSEAGEFKLLVVNEIEALKSVAGKDQLIALESLTSSPEAVAASTKPTREALEAARNEVRLNPFDKIRLESLLKLEKQAGDFAMVHYLEGRLAQSQEKKL